MGSDGGSTNRGLLTGGEVSMEIRRLRLLPTETTSITTSSDCASSSEQREMNSTSLST